MDGVWRLVHAKLNTLENGVSPFTQQWANVHLFSYQAEKEEQAAIQHQTEEAQQPASHLTEWGGAAEQQTGEVSYTVISLLKGSGKLYCYLSVKGISDTLDHYS